MVLKIHKTLKSYMEDYPYCQGYFKYIPYKKLLCFHWMVIARNVPVYKFYVMYVTICEDQCEDIFLPIYGIYHIL